MIMAKHVIALYVNEVDNLLPSRKDCHSYSLGIITHRKCYCTYNMYILYTYIYI